MWYGFGALSDLRQQSVFVNSKIWFNEKSQTYALIVGNLFHYFCFLRFIGSFFLYTDRQCYNRNQRKIYLREIKRISRKQANGIILPQHSKISTHKKISLYLFAIDIMSIFWCPCIIINWLYQPSCFPSSFHN